MVRDWDNLKSSFSGREQQKIQFLGAEKVKQIGLGISGMNFPVEQEFKKKKKKMEIFGVTSHFKL